MHTCVTHFQNLIWRGYSLINEVKIIGIYEVYEDSICANRKAAIWLFVLRIFSKRLKQQVTSGGKGFDQLLENSFIWRGIATNENVTARPW